jgi:hypothetical protein
MLPQVVMVDGVPRCVIRPTDQKALDRFVRNSRKWLQAGNSEGKCTYRPADSTETAVWKDAFELHKAAGADDESFFGIPLIAPAPVPPPSE